MLKKLSVLGLSYSQTQSGAYALILAEENGNRRLPIIIGSPEAQSIAIHLENLQPPRPLTHDLFLALANQYSIKLLKVHIYKLEEGIFYSEIVFELNNVKVRIDARTSDAVALALRFNSPIFTTEDILEKAGVVIDFEDDTPAEKPEIVIQEGEYAGFDMEDLNIMLNEAIATEDYEKASQIRDEINLRTQKEDKT